MSYTRRSLIQHGAALAALGSVPRPVMAMLGDRPEPAPPIEDPRIKRLADAALNAARAAGAAYADARLTHTFTRRLGSSPSEQEGLTFGVRALVSGYWGFAASPVWSTDEAARLARAAVRNAKANTFGKTREMTLAPVAPVANGHWTMPIKDDPFAISEDEISDYMNALVLFLRRLRGTNLQSLGAEFVRQEKAFASTADQYVTQRVYRSSGNFVFSVDVGQRRGMASLSQILPAGLGFEHLRDQPLREYIRAAYEEMKEDLALPVKPVDVGRYDVILDARSVASLMSRTVGISTELDRAIGYEANAGGTSYITDPLEMVGSLKVAAPSVTITGNRSEAGGVSTVQWDDEGVPPRNFTLVKDGVLTDMQTTREGAGWLKPVYVRRGTPVASNGCAYAPEALHVPLTHCANLQVQPANDNTTFESLVSNLRKGVVFQRAEMDVDFQQMTGVTMGTAFEVKDGKRVAMLPGASINFRTAELWSSVLALGGASSRRRYGLEALKGQPRQRGFHSITAVPIACKQLAVIDASRKA